MQFLTNLFAGKKTTATVMSQFSKTLDDLRAVKATHDKAAEEAAIEAQQAQAAHAAARDEAAAASAAAERLESLIGITTAEREGFSAV